jgi:hypothetical protein
MALLVTAPIQCTKLRMRKQGENRDWSVLAPVTRVERMSLKRYN